MARKLAEKLCLWESYAGYDVGELAQDIAAALDACYFDPDGYKLALWLDIHERYEPNAAMVAELEHANDLITEELRVLTEAWLTETGSTPPAAVGDRVTAVWGGDAITGTVITVGMDQTMTLEVAGMDNLPVVDWKHVTRKTNAPPTTA